MAETKGILLISLGGGNYAGWAVNMAASLRYNSPNIKIAVAVDEKSKATLANYPQLFDFIIDANPKDYTNDEGKFAPGKMKLSMYDYSPFDKTIYLDIDGLVIRDIEPLFERLSDFPVASQVNSISTGENTTWPCQWMSLEDTRFVYALGDDFQLPEINSSFMYFEKCKSSELFFDWAKKCYISDYKTSWGASFPDELAFNAASAKSGMPLKFSDNSQCPVNFHIKAHSVSQLSPDCYILGLYGARQAMFQRTYMLYNKMNSVYNAKVLGKSPVWRIDNLMRHKYVSGGNNLVNKKFNVPEYPIFSTEKLHGLLHIGITTAPREDYLLRETENDLLGYNCMVFAEPKSNIEGIKSNVIQGKKTLGGFGNFKNMIAELLKFKEPYFLLCEDDFRIEKGFHHNLSKLVNEGRKGVFSFFQFPNQFHAFENEGWNEFKHDANYAGTVCLLVDRETLKQISESETFVNWVKIHGYNQQRDLCIGTVCKENNIPLYIHQPSLVRHTGYGKSTLDKSHFE